MNKTYALGGAIVLVILAAGYYVYSQRSNEPIESNSVTTEIVPKTNSESINQSNSPKSNEPVVNGHGEYKDYSESELASTSGTKLLFFHAPWCPQCRELDKSILSSELPEGITIFKVDYDSNQALRQKYGVTIQTTVVKIDENSNKIDSYVAYQSPTFDNVKAALLSD